MLVVKSVHEWTRGLDRDHALIRPLIHSFIHSFTRLPDFDPFVRLNFLLGRGIVRSGEKSYRSYDIFPPLLPFSFSGLENRSGNTCLSTTEGVTVIRWLLR